MTYPAYETSTHDGAPVELYNFSFGQGSFFYTSGDVAFVRDGARYQPEAISRTDIENDIEDSSGTITITLPADNPVSKLFQAYLPSSPVKLSIYRTHRSDGQFVLAYAGSITAASYSDSACELTCQPVSSRLGQQVPTTLFQPQCTHVLFSQTEFYSASSYNPAGAQSVGCGLKKAAFRVDVTLTAASGLVITGDAFGAKPAGWFVGGMVEFESGEVRYITEHNGTSVSLAYPISVAAGALAVAYPGCDGIEATCKDKFNNIINFTGFTRIPTRNPYTTSIA